MDKDRDVMLIRTGNVEDDFDRVRECDIIFEAMSDDLMSKQQFYSRLEKVLKKLGLM
jgi:3-hydroxyacyl-CoA dehydrogenase